MKLLFRLFCVLIASTTLLVGCFSSGKFRDYSAKEASGLLQNRLAIVVDVREKEELGVGVIPESHWIPTSVIDSKGHQWQKFEQEILQKNKDKSILFYCASGGRATRIAKSLAEKGYQTGSLGGLNDWQAAKLPVVQFQE